MEDEKIPEPEEVAGLFWSYAERARELRDLYRARALRDQGLANAYEDLIEPLQSLGNAMRPDGLRQLKESDPDHYAMFTRALASNNNAALAHFQEERKHDEMAAGYAFGYTIPASGAGLIDLGYAVAQTSGIRVISFSQSAVDRMLMEPSRAELRAYLDARKPGLGRMLDGCWEAFYGSNPDRLRQAMVSMRELIRMLLDILAPRDTVASKLRLQPKKNPDGSILSPRAQIVHGDQVRYVLESAHDHVRMLAVRDCELVMGWERGVTSASNAPVHGSEEIPRSVIQGILLSGEGLLRTLMEYGR